MNHKVLKADNAASYMLYGVNGAFGKKDLAVCENSMSKQYVKTVCENKAPPLERWELDEVCDPLRPSRSLIRASNFDREQ